MPEAPDEAAHKSMVERFVYCRTLDRFVALDSGEVLTPKGFDTLNTHVARFGKSGEHAAHAQFINLPAARKVATMTYRPGQGHIVEEEINGELRPALNRWRPSRLKPIAGDVGPWLNLIGMLFGEEGAPARDHILDFMAFVVKCQGVKINHAPVLLGEEGIGKDSIMEPLRRAVGLHNAATVNAKELQEPFNGRWIESQFWVFNEIHTFSRREFMDVLKPYIAAPPDTLAVNRKNVPQYDIPNIGNCVMFTNHEDALAPTQGDRRYWVHKCLIDEKPAPALFTTYWDWLNKEGGDAHVFAYLLARDVSAFNPKAPAPMTEAKQEMIDQSSPAPVRWLQSQFARGGLFAGRTAIIVKEVVDTAKHDFEAPNGVSAKYVASVLKARGFQNVGRVAVWAGEESIPLWVRDPSGLLGQQPHSKLKARYLTEAGGKRVTAA